MDEAKRAKLFADLLQEAMDDIYSSPSAEPRKKPATPCGCVDKCSNVSKHDENTVLEGIVLDTDDRTFEASRIQDRFHFGSGMSNL